MTVGWNAGITTPKSTMDAQAFGGATLRRIEWLTIVLGAAGACWTAWRWGWRSSAGVGVGAALSWINFRWLKGSVQAFGRVDLAHDVAVPESDQSPDSDGSSVGGLPVGESSVGQSSPGEFLAERPAASGQRAASVRVPVSAYLKFFGRFGLLLGTVYVILTRSWLPPVPVLTGLFAAAAATVLGLGYQLARGGIATGRE